MTQISSPSAAYRPTHGGYPNPTVEEAAESKEAPATYPLVDDLGHNPAVCPRCVAVDPGFRDYQWSGVV